ncbi:hypothetical protein FMN50_22810 [Rhodobacterales bacterium]|nr:hypothetical protein FMN50_22810 [Rhodobacterales bacterium]
MKIVNFSRPKFREPAKLRPWWVPVNFIFDDGTEISLDLTEEVMKFLEKRLVSEQSDSQFIVFATTEEVVALNVTRLTHWTPDMKSLGLVDSLPGKEGDIPEPVSVHCANLAAAVQFQCAAEETSNVLKPLHTAMLDLNAEDRQAPAFLKVPDEKMQPHFFRKSNVLLFRVPKRIIPDVMD